MLESLRRALASHTGEFACVEIHRAQHTRQVRFAHRYTEPDPGCPLPPVPGLREFYASVGSLTLYLDDESGEAAYHIAPPACWPELDAGFRPWLDGLDADDAADFLPPWLAGCLVVGEIPRSGSYLLVPTQGRDAGRVFEFEHDGFEFLELGDSLADFVTRSLDLDTARLTGIAAHLRFVGDTGRQWWIQEMRDNRGNVVRTEV